MNYCPLISFHKRSSCGVDCMGEDCVLWSYGENECLIRVALLKYTYDIASNTAVSRKDELETQIKILKQQLQAVSMGLPVMNFGNTIDKDQPDLQKGL